MVKKSKQQSDDEAKQKGQSSKGRRGTGGSAMTHTYVVMELSIEAYSEIRAAMLQAGYEHAIDSKNGEIDMHGIAVQVREADNMALEPGDPSVPGLYTKRIYPCGCKAEGPGDVPNYCSEHGHATNQR